MMDAFFDMIVKIFGKYRNDEQLPTPAPDQVIPTSGRNRTKRIRPKPIDGNGELNGLKYNGRLTNRQKNLLKKRKCPHCGLSFEPKWVKRKCISCGTRFGTWDEQQDHCSVCWDKIVACGG